MKPLPSADTGATSTCCADGKRKPTPMQELFAPFYPGCRFVNDVLQIRRVKCLWYIWQGIQSARANLTDEWGSGCNCGNEQPTDS